MHIPDYEHAPGRHCGSTSLRNLATYYGWGFDEPTCFGLASGLGFTYFELPNPPHRAFFGRPPYLERAFFENLGIGYEERSGEDWATAWGEIRARVDAGDPALVFADIYHLDYFGTDTHFSPHALLVVGYGREYEREREEEGAEDEGDGSEGDGGGHGSEEGDGGSHGSGTEYVVLSDSEFPEPQRVPVESLRAAMTVPPDLSYPTRNRYLVVTDPEIRVPVEEAVATATEATARYMLDPRDAVHDVGAFGVHGLDGVRALAADLPGWTALPDPAWTTRFAYQNVERRGTGGGAFRGLQRDFLRTVGHPYGEHVTEETAAIADAWTDAALTLREASEADEAELSRGLAAAGEAIEALADREEALYRSILD
ncbi:BtrH N-terminal domain-containing protein [Halomarina pelagica]|uniref:BtrH N-terminal domain-containing protein n=1 Tax=Halomarina pelagica TaxID=2961599 RepID=UPI0020C4EA12|nr:BtrH N-terminal domain-containing protein [Halomarina sp. BND7]